MTHLGRRYRILFCCISLSLLLVGIACSLFHQNNYGKQLEIGDSPKEVLSRLVYKNELIKQIPGIKVYIDKGKVEYFQSVDRFGNLFTTFFLTYPAGGMGDRSLSFTFRMDDNVIIWSKDRIISINGGLFDFNGDGYLEKIVNFIEEDSDKNKFTDRFKIYSLKNNDPKLILDVKYNLLSVPGDKNYLLLHVIPGSDGDKSIISLDSCLEFDRKIEFVYSPVRLDYFVKGEVSNNWEVLFP